MIEISGENFIEAMKEVGFDGKLILIQGVSGSGKTTLARKLCDLDDTLHFHEADDYFMKNGEYLFDASKLGAAHSQCIERVREDLEKHGKSICSNTLTTDWEIQKYTDLAKELGFQCILVRMGTTFKNTHGVPDEVVERMQRKMEKCKVEPDYLIVR